MTEVYQPGDRLLVTVRAEVDVDGDLMLRDYEGATAWITPKQAVRIERDTEVSS